MGYSFCIVAICANFQNSLIFRILAVFWGRFLRRTTLMCLQKRFTHVFGNFFLTKTGYFAWAIAFALWPFLAIFKMLSFFEYYMFFGAVFCIEKL